MSDHDWGRGAVKVVDMVSHEGEPNGSMLVGVVSDCDELLDADPCSMVWTVSDDESEEPEVSLTVAQFAELLADAKSWRAHVKGCYGCCT